MSNNETPNAWAEAREILDDLEAAIGAAPDIPALAAEIGRENLPHSSDVPSWASRFDGEHRLACERAIRDWILAAEFMVQPEPLVIILLRARIRHGFAILNANSAGLAGKQIPCPFEDPQTAVQAVLVDGWDLFGGGGLTALGEEPLWKPGANRRCGRSNRAAEECRRR